MVRTDEITSTADVIDSRDVIARIDELQDEFAEFQDDEARQAWCDEFGAELESLKTLAIQCEGYGDWQHGEALVNDGYFTRYAEQLAEDVCSVDPNAAWPYNHINWESAAEQLKDDYMSVDFDGTTFWMRSC
jgi:hypothetical protein